jgi:hypothetical protein
LIHAMQRNHENTMLSEKEQTQKGYYCMISLYETPRVDKSRDWTQIGACQGLREVCVCWEDTKE